MSYPKGEQVMKITNLFAGLLLSTILGVGVSTAVTVNSSNEPIKEVDAASYSGSMAIDLQYQSWGGYWDDANAKIACYVWNSNGAGWTNMITTSSGTHKYIIPYNFSFNPVSSSMHIVRFNSSHSDTPDWNDIWGRSDNHTFGHMIYVYGNNEASVVNHYVGANSDGWAGSWEYTLHNAKMNGNDFQVFGDITFTQNDEFKVVHQTDGGAATYVNSYEAHSSISSFFSVTDNIKCSKAGTYSIYYPSDSKIYITNPDYAAADEWAQYFLSNVGCDSTGASLPSGWSSCATEYSKLNGNSKDIVYGASANVSGTFVEQAVARYDLAVSNHPSLTRFIVNSGDKPRLAENVHVSLVFDEKRTGMITIIVVTSVVALTAIGGYFFFRKRKVN